MIKRYLLKRRYRLVEINYKLGLKEESQKYANILGYNYLSSDWYEKSYKFLTMIIKVQMKINNKDKRGIVEKFKKLFN
jgi:outer membrane protein assembly factor BamD